MATMKDSRPTVADKRRNFRSLHESGCFPVPNPWDVGSALYLQSLGFKALATTSAGYAWSQGQRDGSVALEQVLSHFNALVDATDVPINADFEGGFSQGPALISEHVRRACDTGVAGISIEDSTGNPRFPLYDLETATARIQAARHAIDQAGGDVLLIGRAECYFVGRPDVRDAVMRLKAYAQAGADCLYAPGVSSREDIKAIVASVAPKPVNVLVGASTTLSMKELATLGVRRISVGGALAASAWCGFMRAALSLAEEDRFDGLPSAPIGKNLNALFATRAATYGSG
jgi:2-methylisocitrate lyase-like PEP mutase family enzyme